MKRHARNRTSHTQALNHRLADIASQFPGVPVALIIHGQCKGEGGPIVDWQQGNPSRMAVETSPGGVCVATENEVIMRRPPHRSRNNAAGKRLRYQIIDSQQSIRGEYQSLKFARIQANKLRGEGQWVWILNLRTGKPVRDEVAHTGRNYAYGRSGPRRRTNGVTWINQQLRRARKSGSRTELHAIANKLRENDPDAFPEDHAWANEIDAEASR